ncbi:hypothetical protein [Gordoniibacillus kamchatkensis]|uniref:hypothetical protein n=1 Tax=Gordoniibacillus kamchatkensis TaxID=1590651 RepID=UPI000ADB7C4F|nr:hypothetical protein [Paenibacillus sp. VKM B-2647]
MPKRADGDGKIPETKRIPLSTTGRSLVFENAAAELLTGNEALQVGDEADRSGRVLFRS